MSESTKEKVMEYFCATLAMSAPIETIWNKVAAFGEIDTWVDKVEACSLDGEGVGAVRSVTAMGMVMRERIVALDANAHRLVYAVEDPNILPASGVEAEISLLAVGPDLTEVTWRARAESLDVPVADIEAMVGPIYSQSLENLKRVVEA